MESSTDRIKRRIRGLLNLAGDNGAAEGEIDNAVRMAAALKAGRACRALVPSGGWSDSPGVVLKFTGDALRISGRSGEGMTMDRRVPGTIRGVVPFEVGVNPTYLGDVLAALNTADVVIEFVKATHPIVIRSRSAVHVLMPVNL